jgi:hypothetical protein
MPLAVATPATVRNSYSYREIGLHFGTLHYIANTNRKAKEGTAGRSSAVKGRVYVRLMQHARYSMMCVSETMVLETR